MVPTIKDPRNWSFDILQHVPNKDECRFSVQPGAEICCSLLNKGETECTFENCPFVPKDTLKYQTIKGTHLNNEVSRLWYEESSYKSFENTKALFGPHGYYLESISIGDNGTFTLTLNKDKIAENIEAKSYFDAHSHLINLPKMEKTADNTPGYIASKAYQGCEGPDPVNHPIDNFTPCCRCRLKEIPKECNAFRERKNRHMTHKTGSELPLPEALK